MPTIAPSATNTNPRRMGSKSIDTYNSKGKVIHRESYKIPWGTAEKLMNSACVREERFRRAETQRKNERLKGRGEAEARTAPHARAQGVREAGGSLGSPVPGTDRSGRRRPSRGQSQGKALTCPSSHACCSPATSGRTRPCFRYTALIILSH